MSERSSNLKKNIYLTFILRGISFVSNFLLIPITINYLNPSKYGIWLTISSIVGWFMLFDIGLGNGLRNKLAEALALKNYQLGRIYISTSFAILSIIISVVLVAFFIVNHFLNWQILLSAPKEIDQELSLVVIYVFTFFCIQFVLRLIGTILTAIQKPAINDLLNIIANILALGIIYTLSLYTKNSLLYVAIVFSAAPVLVFMIAYFVLFGGKYDYLKPSLNCIDFSFFKDLMGLGIKFFFIQIASLVIYSTSNIIIIRSLGAEQVTVYNIAFKYFSIVSMSFSIITAPLWSAFTEAFITNDYNWIRSTVNKMNKIWVLSVILTICMIVFADVFYEFWVGKSVKVPPLLNYMCALYVLISNYGSIYMMFLNGIGKVTIQLIGIIISSILFIPLSVYLVHQMGTSGVALAGAIVILLYVFLAPIQYLKIINQKAKGIWNL
jgi:O-antigen/teichoic acid export membrane protein